MVMVDVNPSQEIPACRRLTPAVAMLVFTSPQTRQARCSVKVPIILLGGKSFRRQRQCSGHIASAQPDH
jgi:hypothetical protein